jgi:arylsulfatase A-like enzyme
VLACVLPRSGGPTAHAASNYPLKGGKGTCWEGGARGVGFVTAGTQLGLPSHIESHALIHVTDWVSPPGYNALLCPHGTAHVEGLAFASRSAELPTLCEIAGCVTLGSTKLLDGVSAWGAIARGAASGRNEVLISLSEVAFSPAIRVGRYKLIGTPPKLYDLRRDPFEQVDLAKAMPQVVVRLQQRLTEHNATAVPPCDRLRPVPAANPARHGGAWMPWNDSVHGNGCPAKPS